MNQLVAINIKKLLNRNLITPIEKRLFNSGIRPFWMPIQPLQNTYSLVVPCYNVARYLDKFLNSVATQTSGHRNLEVILVDDGSTDSTPEIAQRWASKFPDWIKYHRQENKGLCGARNTGLAMAKGDWISFPDPDDFLNHRYLEVIDAALNSEPDREMTIVCCNFIRFYEKSGNRRDDHGLKFRFKNGKKVVPVSEMGNFMQLAINSAFLRRQDMLDLGLSFNSLIVPGFEDAEVVNRYLLNHPNGHAAFLPAAKYYYCKRADESSLQDTARSKKEFYLNQPKYGWLSVLDAAEALHGGEIPEFIQRTVLYDTIGHFRSHLKRPQNINFLTDEEKEDYYGTMELALRRLSPDLIAKTDLPGLYEDLRVGMLNLFFGLKRETASAYVTHYDDQKNIARISIYTSDASLDPLIENNGDEVLKIFRKSIRNNFVGRCFFYEIAFWVAVEPGVLKISLPSQDIRFRMKGKSYNDGITRSEIVKKFSKKSGGSTVRDLLSRKFSDAWLVMDRCDKADDNAEHFYRYLMKVGRAENAYFLLNKDSTDWSRLKSEGFKLIAFRSFRHMIAAKQAKYLISSHADAFIRKPFPKNIQDACNYQFLFIQHGVTKDNQSEWFNAIMPSLLATATNSEYSSIVAQNSDYHLSDREVFLTGFPRHDNLLEIPATKDTIFVMPTWREHLSGKVIRPGVRALKADAANSEYFQKWSSLLCSPELLDVAHRNGLQIVFCPHPNLAGHLSSFSVPSHVEILGSSDVPSLQPYFAAAAVMVTDYSSVAFDAGILDKPVVYYQFDSERFFSGHIYRPGYFDYTRDGFGPVVETETGVINAVSAAVSGREDPEYSARRVDTFPYKDGGSSRRLLDAIDKLTA